MTMQRTAITACALLLGLFPIQASAQSRTTFVDSAQGVTVDQLVEMALTRAPDILSARTEIDAARGQLGQARERPNPTLSSSWQEQTKGPDHQAMVEVEWPLDLFRRDGRIATAERTIEVASRSVQDRERLFASAVREQAGRMLTAARTLAIGDDLLALNRRSRELLQARVKEGASPQLELNLVDVEVRRMEAERAIQAAEAEAALIELKALVGLLPDAELQLRNDLEQTVRMQAPIAPALPGGTDALDGTIARRPDVREAAARVQLADARIGETRQEGRFDASLYGAYSRMNFSFPLRAFDAAGQLVPVRDVFHNVSFGAMVKVPVRSRNQGAIAAAEAARRGAEQTVKARELSARAEIAAAATRAREARRAVELYGAGARELARRNLEVVREAYELGRNPLFDVFVEQRRYLDVETAYTDALRQAYQARTALMRALGEVQ